MAELPKIVRQRLQAQGLAQGTAGSGQTAEHPDPNLLTAFAEQSLAARERAQVLEHLAQCAACREVVSLALPQEAVAAAPQRSRAEVPWFRWQTLRWGALAASLAVAAIAVLVGPASLLRSRMAMPTVTRESAPAPAQPRLEAEKTAPAPPTAAQPAAKPEARENKDQVAAGRAGKAPAAAPGNASGQPAAPEQKQLAQAPGGSTQTYARLADKDAANRVASRAAGPPAPAAAAAPGAVAEVAQADTAAAEKRAAAREEVGTAAKPLETRKAAAPAATDVSKSEAAAPRPAPAARAQKEGGLAGTLGISRAVAPTTEAGAASFRWTISSTGKLQRSQDGGQHWTEVAVGERMSFRAVAAVGANVWAGGAAGALYHSVDGGEHWTRVTVEEHGQALEGDIVRLDFADTAHGTVVTASGEKWTTADGGRSWKRQ